MIKEGQSERRLERRFEDFLNELGRNRNINPELLGKLNEVLENRSPTEVYNWIVGRLKSLGDRQMNGWTDLGRAEVIIRASDAEGWNQANHKLIAQRFGAFADYQLLTRGGQLEKILQELLIAFGDSA